MFRLSILISIIFLIMLQFACKIQSEKEAFQSAMTMPSAKDRVIALDNFLKNYPENEDKEKVLLRLFRDYASLGNENKAVSTAARYLEFFPRGYRMSQYNEIAWVLAENKMGLDSAKVYADRAVEQAKDSGVRTLNNIKDTQAYVYFQSGDAKRALSIQEEVMNGNEENPGFLNRLALYQHGAGYWEKSLYTIAKTILLGGGLESERNFQNWLTENDDTETVKKVLNKVIDEYLEDNESAARKSHCAVLLALAGIDIIKAEKWAKEGIASISEQTSFEDQLQFHQNLAAVYNVQGKSEDALNVLLPVKELASIYDSAFWLALGNAYHLNNLKDEAIDAYVNGMLWRTLSELWDAATELGYDESDIKKRLEKRKKELRNFHPGNFEKENNFSGRVVLAELFTGAECNPCKGADLAFDLLAEYYPRSVLAILEYHVHIPGPDPLTNQDTEKRRKYYGNNFGTPTAFFNGGGRIIGGGSDLIKKDAFINYKKSIEKYFDDEPAADMNLSAQLTGKNVEVNTEIVSNTDTLENINLYIALVEKSVDYVGSNGITKHAFVVRYLATGEEGQPVKWQQMTFKFNKRIDLAEVENRQSDYLTRFEKDPPKRYRRFTGWKETTEKMDDNNLAIVAWIQENQSKKVLQSAYYKL